MRHTEVKPKTCKLLVNSILVLANHCSYEGYFTTTIEWEREIMLERQKIGIAKAKSEGKYKGRVPTARKLEKEIQRLHLEGIKPSVIAKELNIGVASV